MQQNFMVFLQMVLSLELCQTPIANGKAHLRVNDAFGVLIL